MHSIPDPSRCLQRPKSFARHSTLRIGHYPLIFPLIWIENRHFLFLEAEKEPGFAYKASHTVSFCAAAI